MIGKPYPLAKLKPYENNAKKHPREQIEELKWSLQTFGWYAPIVADEDDVIVIGHGRHIAATELGQEEVPVLHVKAGTKPEQLQALRLFDNRVGETGYDKKKLKAELNDFLAKPDVDVSWTGYTAAEVVPMLPEDHVYVAAYERAKEAKQTEEETVPQVSTDFVKRGQVWALGDHRLMCGDSCDLQDVTNLLDGERAQLVFTDPPYNLASDANLSTGISGAYDRLKNSDWDKNFDIRRVFPSLALAMAENSTIYVCTSHFLAGKIWEWMASHLDYSNTCVWAKPNPMPSLAKRHWTWATEIICYGTRGKHVFNFPEEGHASNVWAIKKGAKNDLHPTMKPIEVPRHAIRHSSEPGALVVDLFGGSGSTLIACETEGRRAKLMELDPHYCSVIIRRWEQLTGKKAELLRDLDVGF